MYPGSLAGSRLPRLLALMLTGWPVLAAASATLVLRDGVSPPGYAGTRDVTIANGADDAWEQDTNYDGLDRLDVDGNPGKRVVLMRWDLSPLPAGATVTGASLTLRVVDGTANSFTLYECLKPWVEGEATFNHYATSKSWTLPGAEAALPSSEPDRDSLPLGLLNGNATGLRTFALSPTVVQKWVDLPTQNHGLVVTGAAADRFSWLDSETPNIANRPRLTVTWSDPQGVARTLTLQNGVPAGTGTVPYTGNTDVVIARDSDPRNWNRNGWGHQLEGNPALKGTLLGFDLSAIPVWSTVRGAALGLHVLVPTAGSASFEIVEVLRPWVETEATWNQYRADSPWGSPGAQGTEDRGNVVLSAVQPSDGGPRLVLFDTHGISLVQAWVSGTRPNHGVLIGSTTASGNAYLADRENTTPEWRPTLIVEYTEGRLVLSGGPVSPNTPAVMRVRRERLDGVPIDVGAPALTVTLSTDSRTGRFSASPAPDGASPTLEVQIPAGTSESPDFYFHDTDPVSPKVIARAGAAWDEGARFVPVTRPDGGTPDGGKPDGGADGGPEDGGTADGGSPGEPTALTVGCGCSGAGGFPTFVLGALALLALVRSTAGARPPGRKKTPEPRR